MGTMFRGMLAAMVAVGTLMAPTAANAQFKLGLGVGYSIPMGKENADWDLASTRSGQVPIDFSAAFKLTYRLSLGLYGGYSFTQVASGITAARVKSSDVWDSSSSYRVGAQAEFEFSPELRLGPWAALRAGYVYDAWKTKPSLGMGASLKLIASLAFPPTPAFAITRPLQSLAARST